MAKKKPELRTEEERMEAARAWWQENGKFVIIGAGLGIAAVLGWRGWEEYQTRHARGAASLYYQLYENLASQFEKRESEEIDELLNDPSDEEGDMGAAAMEARTNEGSATPAHVSTADMDEGSTTPAALAESETDDDEVIAGMKRFRINYDPAIFETLKRQYSDTVYPAMAYMEVARIDVENGDLERAVDKLTWVARTTTHQALKHIADIRRARVLIALDRVDEALKVLNDNEFPQEMEYLVEEARGDALVKKEEAEDAASAYRKAIKSSVRPSDFLQMKLDALGLDSE